MKKQNLILAILAVCSLVGVSARADGFGVNAGVNIASISTTLPAAIGTYNSSSKIGFDVGATYLFAINPNFGIEPGVSFVQRGYKAPPSNNVTISNNLNYIEIPVLFKGMLPMGGATGFLGVGPVLGLKISDGCSSDAAAGTCTVAANTFKSTDFGAEAALGVAIPTGSGDFTIQVRYHLGLTNILDTAVTALDPTGVLSFKNTGLAFLVGWNFM